MKAISKAKPKQGMKPPMGGKIPPDNERPAISKPKSVRGMIETEGYRYIDFLNEKLLWVNQNSEMAYCNVLLAQREGAEELLKRIIARVFEG